MWPFPLMIDAAKQTFSTDASRGGEHFLGRP